MWGVCGGGDIWGMCQSSGVGVFYSMSRSGTYQFESGYHKGESTIIGHLWGCVCVCVCVGGGIFGVCV